MDDVFSPGSWKFFMSVARVIAPGTADLNEAGKDKFKAIIVWGISDKPAFVRNGFLFFLFVLKWMTLPFFFRTYDHVSLKWQTRILRMLESFPVRLVRTGIWGLKTLVFMGYYGQTDVAERLGYKPSFEGNEVLRAGKGI